MRKSKFNQNYWHCQNKIRGKKMRGSNYKENNWKIANLMIYLELKDNFKALLLISRN